MAKKWRVKVFWQLYHVVYSDIIDLIDNVATGI